MKTTATTGKIAQAGLIAGIFFLAFAAAVQAADFGKASKSKEIKEATGRLEAYNHEIERTIRYSVPSASESRIEYFELEEAGFRLEETANALENAVRYVAPSVNESYEDYEVEQAVDNLDTLSNHIEKSLQYTAPAVDE